MDTTACDIIRASSDIINQVTSLRDIIRASSDVINQSLKMQASYRSLLMDTLADQNWNRVIIPHNYIHGVLGLSDRDSTRIHLNYLERVDGLPDQCLRRVFIPNVYIDRVLGLSDVNLRRAYLNYLDRLDGLPERYLRRVPYNFTNGGDSLPDWYLIVPHNYMTTDEGLLNYLTDTHLYMPD